MRYYLKKKKGKQSFFVNYKSTEQRLKSKNCGGQGM